MIVIESTDTIQAVLAGAVATLQPQALASYRDITTTAYTPGKKATNLNSTTDVDIVAAPAASTQRVIDLINIYNRDSAAVTLTVKLDVSATETILWKGSLGIGESVIYSEGAGWQKLSSSGVPLAAGATFGTPALVLGTANAAGATDEAIRRDATILAFDATVPAALGTAAAGSATVAARRDHVHPIAPGAELAYGEITANVNITATSGATADSVVSSGAVTYDGTAVYVEFYALTLERGTGYLRLVLYDGATELGLIGQTNNVGDCPGTLRRKLTPSAGSHTYQIKGFVDAGTGIVYAGTGAAGAFMPAYCRVVKA